MTEIEYIEFCKEQALSLEYPFEFLGRQLIDLYYSAVQHKAYPKYSKTLTPSTKFSLPNPFAPQQSGNQ